MITALKNPRRISYIMKALDDNLTFNDLAG